MAQVAEVNRDEMLEGIRTGQQIRLGVRSVYVGAASKSAIEAAGGRYLMDWFAPTGSVAQVIEAMLDNLQDGRRLRDAYERALQSNAPRGGEHTERHLAEAFQKAAGRVYR